jgi:hypothetical protein
MAKIGSGTALCLSTLHSPVSVISSVLIHLLSTQLIVKNTIFINNPKACKNCWVLFYRLHIWSFTYREHNICATLIICPLKRSWTVLVEYFVVCVGNMFNFCFFLINTWGNIPKQWLQNGFCCHMYWMRLNVFSGISDSTTLYCTSHECIFCLHHSLHASLYILSHSSHRANLCNLQFISVDLYVAHPRFILPSNIFAVEINHQNILHKKVSFVTL